MKTLMNEQEIQRSLERLVYQILEKHSNTENIILVGIQRRGVDLSKRLAQILKEKTEQDIKMGTLDINLYRDDWTSLANFPAIGSSHIPQNIDNASIILIDDVLYTGRTIRAALEALSDYGRPKQIELLVLIDRGHRELPIAADYIGKHIDTARTEQINVLLKERDGQDEVRLIHGS